MELGGDAIIASRVPATRDLYVVRSYPAAASRERLQLLQLLKHQNVLQYQESFLCDDAFYIVFEHAEISLAELIVARPGEAELVAIAYQVRGTMAGLRGSSLMQTTGDRLPCPLRG